MDSQKKRELNISKIVNLQMSETLVNIASETCKVVPFDHNLLLDIGLYNRLTDESGAIYSTSGAERRECYDKWSHQTHYYIKISNESGEEKYSTQPKYLFNKEANTKNGFATYKTSPIKLKNSFTYLFFTALKVVKTILTDDYFIATHGNLLGEVNRQIRGIIKDYTPTKETLSRLYTMSEADMIVMLCTYSTYFLQINFIEPNPEVTVEHRLMAKILNTIHKEQNRILTPAIRDAYLDFLGILSRGLEVSNYNGEWVAKTSIGRTFNHEVYSTFMKYRKVHMAGATGNFVKFIESLEDELCVLVGYLPALTDMNSAEKFKYESSYRELRSLFIRPYIESSKTYDECARKVIQDMSKDMTNSLKDSITLLETASNLDHSIDCSKVLTEESKKIIAGQIEEYARSKKRYLDRVISNIPTGVFLISDETNPVAENLFKDIVDVYTYQQLSNGCVPLGLTLYRENLVEVYNGDVPTANSVMYYMAQQYLTTPFDTFTAMYSPLLYCLLQTTQTDRLPLSSRRDSVENKCRVSEIEFMNAVLTSFLRNVLKQVNHTKGQLSPVLTINSQIASMCVRAKANQFLDYAQTIQYTIDENGAASSRCYFESVGHLYNSIADELDRTDVLLSIDALVDNKTKLSIHANIFLLDNIQLIRDAVQEIQPSYGDAELFSAQFIKSDAIEIIAETGRQINSYLMDFYTLFSEANLVMKKYYTNFNSYKSSLTEEEFYRKAWELEHIQLYNTNDLKCTTDYDLVHTGVRSLLSQHLKSCMIELEDCVATGHLRREFVDIHKEDAHYQSVSFFDVSTLDVQLSLPYIEFYDILNSTDVTQFSPVCKKSTYYQSEGTIQAWV